MKIVLLFFCLVLAGCGSAGSLSAPPNSPMPSPAATPALLFDDEFNGTSLDTTKWYRCYPNADENTGCSGGANNYEMQWYQTANVTVSGGNAQLTARIQSINGYAYTSGMIETGGSPAMPPTFSYLYGYAEMRAKLPPGVGMWPAFWALRADGVFPWEIDGMEWYGAQPLIDQATIHFQAPDGSVQADNTGYTAASDLSAGYHVYAFDWEPQAVVWYLDGVEIKRFTNAAAIPNQPMYLIANLAVGGPNNPSAPPAPSVFPATMSIDYIRVWAAKP